MSESEGLPAPRRYWALLVVTIGIGMAMLDGSIVNMALPTLSRTLHATAAETIWAVNGYQIGSCVLLLPAAALGEIIGYRKIYLSGMAVFTLASLACALAPNLPVLVLARFAQGLGSAGIMASNGALIRYSAPTGLVHKFIGWNIFVSGVCTAAAPSLASAILTVADWRWLFAVNLPFGVAALVIGFLALPAHELSPRPLDYISATLTAVAFGSLIVGLDLLARSGTVGLGIVLLAISLFAIVAVARREWRIKTPLLPLDLLRIPILGLSVATAATFYCAQMLGFIVLPFLLQLGLGRSVVQMALLMTVWPLAAAIAAPVAGALFDRFSAAMLVTAGLVCFAAGMVLLAFIPAHASDLEIGWRMALCGFGFGFFQPPNNRAILMSSPKARSGAAGGLISMGRLTGQGLGAVTAALFYGVMTMQTANVAALIGAAGMALAAAVFSVMRAGKHSPTEAAPSGQR